MELRRDALGSVSSDIHRATCRQLPLPARDHVRVYTPFTTNLGCVDTRLVGQGNCFTFGLPGVLSSGILSSFRHDVSPDLANTVWPIDFIFDRFANGRQLKILGIVDDATTECVVAHAEHALGGDYLVRILGRICQRRGYPDIIRTDNSKEFTRRAMLEWAHRNNRKLRLIEPGKPNQNAYIESFNSRFRDECLNEHWIFNMRHARRLIEAWQREYNEGRPKKGLGGLTPVEHARRVAKRSIIVSASLQIGVLLNKG